MEARYASWVEGLNSDWLISRQRFFGVPFPVWYRLDAHGRRRTTTTPLCPTEADLPVDPTTDVPAGFTEAQRDQPGGFVADPDVMDTWATSSLTPQIAGRWEDDPDLFARVFPMDLRPQAHDIIRTWLFSTVVRSHLEFDALPWSDAAISGWILDPDRKKMSKSKGNVVTPMALLEQYGSDAVRYWAASARPGTDTAFDEGQMQIGRKLAIKLLNASQFVLESATPGRPPTRPPPRRGRAGPRSPSTAPLLTGALAAPGRRGHRRLRGLRLRPGPRADRGVLLDVLRRLRRAGQEPGLRRRSATDRARSARATLRLALSVLLRLFAPFLPFVTEEVWSWWHDGAARSTGPRGRRSTELGDAGGDPGDLDGGQRAARRGPQGQDRGRRSLRAPVAALTWPRPRIAWRCCGRPRTTCAQAGVIGEIRWTVVDSPADADVHVKLADVRLAARSRAAHDPGVRCDSAGPRTVRRMPINPDAVGYTSEPARASWNSKDCLLYALGVGAGVADPTGFELEFTTENSQDVDPEGPPDLPRRHPGGGERLRQGRHLQPGDAGPRRAVRRAARPRCPSRARSSRSPPSPASTTRAPARWWPPSTVATDKQTGQGPVDHDDESRSSGAKAAWGGDRGPSGRCQDPRPGPRPRGHLRHPARPGAALPPVGRPQPAALRSQVRRHGRVRQAHPARAVQLRLHRPGPAAHPVRIGSRPLRLHVRPLLQAGLPGRGAHRVHVGRQMARRCSGPPRHRAW